MKWTRKKFKEQFGEDPEDVIGPDWENYVNEYAESEIGEHNERTEISN